jgi:hypothetical protein
MYKAEVNTTDTCSKSLGKITSARFGAGGYQDAMIGLSIGLSYGTCCEVSDFIGGSWRPSVISCDKYSRWTEKDRDDGFSKMVREIDLILSDAKVGDVARLVGKPVEITTGGNTLKSWRILTEVL